jgi:hypothetical protein
MQYGFITILARREACFGPKILVRDRHFNVESKKAIMQTHFINPFNLERSKCIRLKSEASSLIVPALYI